MAKGNTKLNPATDTPENKTQVTKSFMIEYLKTVATEDDRKWFKKICSNPDNQKEYTNRSTGKTYTDVDISAVRDEFCKRFFSNMTKKKKKVSDKQTFLDLVNSI